MIISDKILPIRFYDNLYDQNRFSKNCHETCQFDLVYPAHKLPNFQFRRDAIFALPSKMYLRNICTDQLYDYYHEIQEGVDSFCNESLCDSFYRQSFPIKEITGYTMEGTPIYGPNDGLLLDCCKLKGGTLSGAYALSDIVVTLPTSSPLKRKVKIIVDKFVSTAGFSIKLYNNSILFATITAAGIYEFEFTDAGTGEFTIKFPSYVIGDYFEISYLQTTVNYFETLLSQDIELSANDISVTNMIDQTDILTYCSPNSYTSNIPNGKYYYVVKSGSNIYFSEVFKIVSLKEIQDYFKITWYDDCDFNSNVIYKTDTTGCQFKNVLYLDSTLLKPEYDTQEESEVNGQGDLSVRFKKWQKNISLEIAKSPSFLTDALSAIFLHENITILEPLNYLQDTQSNEFEVLKITNDIGDVFESCYQRVGLKLLLEDKITDTKCCNTAEIVSCDPCDFNAALDIEGCTSYYVTVVDGYLNWYATGASGVPRYSFTLRDCQGNVVNPRSTDIICYNGSYYTMSWYSGLDDYGNTIQFWYYTQEYPTIAIAWVFTNVAVSGYVFPNTWAKIYRRINGGSWVYVDNVQADSNGYYYYLDSPYLFSEVEITKVEYQVFNGTVNCNFGEGTDIVCLGIDC